MSGASVVATQCAATRAENMDAEMELVQCPHCARATNHPDRDQNGTARTIAGSTQKARYVVATSQFE